MTDFPLSSVLQFLHQDSIEGDFEVHHDSDKRSRVEIGPIKYTAKESGPNGNDISIEYVDPSEPDDESSVSVIGKAIQVSLATDETGRIIATAENIVALVIDHVDAGALVLASRIGDLTEAATAVPAINLVGGDADPLTIPVWDTAKLGSVKRIDEYRTVSETAQFKAWHKNWYRARKIAHGHTPESAEAKVNRAFP